ncbi:biotin transporter BioY [Zwartia sp.]|uniref:biotin transporter BioY n=1 Tax=Zwartia sp. TaxID=2978004 RepID=UPI00271B7B67|nr:biotin transporter BioY [Zwartia sp.]MDO9023400.1 biotin transporter BioY [Zwartia sp.]
MLKTKDLALIALFTAMIVVLGLIPPVPVPWVPVPVTLQTFGVMLAGLILGPWRGGLVVLTYVLIALLGLPVLPGGRAGLAVLAGPTGGFLLGMIPGAVVTGWLAGRIPATGSVAGSGSLAAATPQILRCWIASVVGGMLVVYAAGIPWLAAVTGMGLEKATWAIAVFLPGDLLKALVASIVAQRVRRLALV